MSETATLTLEGKKYEFPVIEGTEKEKAIDISTLRAKSGYITLDRGFKNTGSCQSKITFLDGEKGILKYRGYPIEQLAENSTFLEVSYLLIYKDLPSKKTHDQFIEDIKKHTLPSEEIRKVLDGFPSTSHPMGVLSSLVTAQTAYYPNSILPNRSEEDLKLSILRILAKIPTFSAWIYRKKMGLPLSYPVNAYDYCSNFLHVMFSLPTEDYEVDKVIANALDKLLILHADHEQNCSTATMRVVGSSQASIWSCISAGINALWGPLHGGANQAVIEMLENIRKDGGNTKKWMEKAKDKNDPFRLMGFGHRVYKNFDPRAKIIKKAADDVLNKLGIVDPILDIAKSIEEEALSDSYFVERKLYPNVDFYSGIIYRALGIPTDMFTVMFVIGRLPGWIAQWKELRENNEPIGRPRQVYIGETSKNYIGLSKR